MSYTKEHTEDDCDKCLKKVGKQNLRKVPFLYLDKNDKRHKDVSHKIKGKHDTGYRQYYICEDCKP